MIVDLDPQILWSYLGVLSLITLNALLGMLRAVVNDKFSWSHMPNFLKEHILPDGGALFLVGITALVMPEAKALYLGILAVATVKYIRRITEKLAHHELVE